MMDIEKLMEHHTKGGAMIVTSNGEKEYVLLESEMQDIKKQLAEARKEIYRLKDEVGDNSSAFLLSQQENKRLKEIIKEAYEDLNEMESGHAMRTLGVEVEKWKAQEKGGEK